MNNNDNIEDRIKSLVGDGYRLLEEGEPRKAGDEFILFDTDGSFYSYWPWDARFDAAVQGKLWSCKPTRRKVSNEIVKVKPCPYCGSQPKAIMVKGWNKVRCVSVSCGVRPCTRGCDTEQTAIMIWNDRQEGKKNE